MRDAMIIAFLALLAAGCSKQDVAVRACTPPLTSWLAPHPHLGPDIPTFRVSLDRNGVIYFDGARLSPVQLAARLDEVHRLHTPDPAIVLETEMGAPCQVLDDVRSIMNEHLQCHRGAHCDEGVEAVRQTIPYTGEGVP